MRELPILFSTEMVRAILDGTKTQTRRIIKPQPYYFYPTNILGEPQTVIPARYGAVMPDKSEQWIKSPYQVGDILWVRETTWISECKRYIAQGLERGHSSKLDIINLETGKRYIWQDNRGDYAFTDAMITSWSWEGRYLRNNRQTPDFGVGFADVDTTIKIVPFSGNIILKKYEAQFRKKLPSIFMPKSAARIWIEVTDVRVERLQEITWEDALAEGINHEDAEDGNLCSYCKVNESHKGVRNYGNGPVYCVDSGQCDVAKLAFEDDCIDCFSELWDSIYQKQGHGWDASPWVWVIEFKRLEGYR